MRQAIEPAGSRSVQSLPSRTYAGEPVGGGMPSRGTAATTSPLSPTWMVGPAPRTQTAKAPAATPAAASESFSGVPCATGSAAALAPAQDRARVRLGLLEADQVAGVPDQLEAGAGDPLGEDARVERC